MKQKPNPAAWVAIVWLFAPVILCVAGALVVYISGYSLDKFLLILFGG